MKNEDFKELVDRRLSGLVWDEASRRKVLNAVHEEEKPMKKKVSFTVVLALAVLCIAAVAIAEGLMFSPRYSAVRLANQAMEQQYGITPDILSLFYRQVEQHADGSATVTYSVPGENGLPAEQMGEYTVEVKDNRAKASWSNEGKDTSGGLAAEAFGAEQLRLLSYDYDNAMRQLRDSGTIQPKAYPSPLPLDSDSPTPLPIVWTAEDQAEADKALAEWEKADQERRAEIAKAEALGGELEAKLVTASESGDGNAITAIAKDMDDNKKKVDQLYEDMKPMMPAGLEFVKLETSDDFLYAAIGNVVETLIIAIILVILVVFFFLQNFKATIIPSISIIVSLLGTFAIVSLAGFSLNILTLFALVLAIGTVVDDAIVVVEAVMAKMESGISDARQATREAMSEVSVAVISCTLVFMAVFIPVAFMPGTSGAFFTQFGVTIASSVGLSCVSALTLCPALCAIMLRVTEGKKEGKGITYYTKKAYSASYNAIFNKYSKSVQKFIKRPVLAWGLLAVAAFLLIFFMRNLPSGLVPQEDQGVILAEIRAPEGTTLHETREIVKKVEEKVTAIPEMESFATACGYGMMSGAGSNYATMIIRLKPWEEREGFNHYVDLVIGRLYFASKEIKNAQVMPFQLPQVPGYGSNNSVNLVLQDLNDGDLSEFASLTNNFLTKLGERPEISMAMTSYSERFPKYQVEVDATQCDRAGISPASVLRNLGAYCGGSYVGNYNQFGKVYRIMASASPEYRLDPSSLNNIFVRVRGGKMAPIAEFVTLKEVVGTSSVEHFNLFQSITCFVQAANGYTEGDAHKVIAEVFKETMPNGYAYEYSGMSRELEEAAGSNATALIYVICVILIYLILASLYNSWFTPWAVLLSVPFGLMGAFVFAYLGSLLHLPGMDNNIYLQTGVIMLIGLLSKTAILITEFASERRAQGMSISGAAFEACKERLRPILMTVFTMIAGMIPLIIEGGAGANGNRALALGVVGGMSVGTIALLFVVPVFFIVFQKLHERFQGKDLNLTEE